MSSLYSSPYPFEFPSLYGMHLTTKDDDYLQWRKYVLIFMPWYRDVKFIDCPPPSPPVQITGQLEPDSEYLSWYRRDQDVFRWLRSSVKEPILSQVGSCSTSYELWSTLSQLFSSTLDARVSDLRRQLETTKKGSTSCSNYVDQMREITKELKALGFPVSEKDLIRAILNGLGPAFNGFIKAYTNVRLNAQASEFEFDCGDYSDFYYNLIDAEYRIQDYYRILGLRFP